MLKNLTKINVKIHTFKSILATLVQILLDVRITSLLESYCYRAQRNTCCFARCSKDFETSSDLKEVLKRCFQVLMKRVCFFYTTCSKTDYFFQACNHLSSQSSQFICVWRKVLDSTLIFIKVRLFWDWLHSVTLPAHYFCVRVHTSNSLTPTHYYLSGSLS